ncbi:DNA polymerase III subunit alpha [Candidatus Gromoviella agglomerans]|uniref:DNA polymerase III subunit alpha n=1 Tax=Candidatus Gromoviella agglomerans TaxID=2806609 RepID=UPI001E5E7E07|nr:DNA polymerase III subunit alpha [Candidatus Gromoviella agglomerans]UFX98290.1 DNA polymerase III subunit alpha [Candidatus Gromoviella agglomerans]
MKIEKNEICEVSYVSLRNRTDYSLLECPMHVDTLIAASKEIGFPAIAITDNNNLFGAIEFSTKCIKNSIQPIIGCQMYVATRNDKNNIELTSIIIYARTEIGYKNLIKINTLSHMNKNEMYKKITINDLINNKDGLSIMFDFQNDLKNNINIGVFKQIKKVFQTEFYAEISRNRLIREDIKETATTKLSSQENVPIIATNDVFFEKREDYRAYQVLRCIDRGEYISNFTDTYVTEENYLKSFTEMEILFSDMPIALKNSVHLAKKCNFLLQKRNTIFPKFSCVRSEEEELEVRAKIGLIKIFLRKQNRSVEEIDEAVSYKSDISSINSQLQKIVPENYATQIEYELSVTSKVGFSGYFLIVADFISWAKSNHIPVGPGRGSGAGSVVAWSLSITTIDPIRFSLLFERFLNPDRISLPDFDIDFCQERRNEVIEYVKQKYGYDCVAHIITFGKLQPKAALKDIGRVMLMPYTLVDNIAQLIPFSAIQQVTLSEAIAKEKKLQEMQDKDAKIKELFSIALKLEGTNRHVSVHAAGTVISPEPILNIIPIYREIDSDDIITQFHMYGVEESGLIKFDFLGLKTLTVIKNTTNFVKQYRNIDVDIDCIDLKDQNTFKILRDKKTLGVFQLEGSGMSDVLEQLKIDEFEQIIALVSLYRPGPMENISQYISCKNGEEEISYAYPCLEPILKETYGIPVYQEQVMKIAQTLAGYSLAQADLLRRAMGKKLPEEMKKHENVFIEEAMKNHGGQREKASSVFNQIAKFAGYAFNKAHATSYAMISYQTAYLKANYTIEFFTALLTSDIQQSEKIAHIIQDIRKFNIEVLPPNINSSMVKFSIENGGIRYAISAIKGIGMQCAESIVREREKNGPYSSIHDLICRLSDTSINKKQLENLIAAGAFDQLHNNRRDIYEGVKDILNNKNTQLLFSSQIFNSDASNWSIHTKMQKEFEAMGFYLSKHPTELYKDYISHISALNTKTIFTSQVKQAKIVATIIIISKKLNKMREKYAFVTLSDNHGMCEMTIFPKIMQQYEDILREGENYLFHVSCRNQNGTISLSCITVQQLTDAVIDNLSAITFRVSNKDEITEIKNLLNQSNSNNLAKTSAKIYIILQIENHQIKFRINNSVKVTPKLMQFCYENNAKIEW